MIVVDASAFLNLILRTGAGLSLEERLEHEPAAAPELFDAEVLHRLVTFGKHGVLDGSEVERAVTNLRDAPVVRVPHRWLLDRARALSAALSGYDALYAALAEATGAPLVTGDEAFARTARAQLHLDVVDLP